MSEEEANPFVPSGEEESEQTCWRDSARYCGEDCVAFDDKSLTDPRWMPCTILNVKRAQAKSFANIAAELQRFNDGMASSAKKAESQAYAEKVKEMDAPPPKIT